VKAEPMMGTSTRIATANRTLRRERFGFSVWRLPLTDPAVAVEGDSNPYGSRAGTVVGQGGVPAGRYENVVGWPDWVAVPHRGQVVAESGS
jgi:hypothetical protein